ncbi:nitroreductase family deazaflavin-dependent oxidoreductase [Pseudonocardia nantongensis]|uniref:nitroreductase family deazaflavin-dependent oxidoreductase n=1 Tax=Pseudonocardia nantongensis TaxID=1181885 RepID=UPI0039784FAB
MAAVRERVRSIVVDVGERVLRTPALVRLPNLAYRHGFGMVFGSRMLMLEHTGRRSGLRREVVLEVIGHPEVDRYVVVSGFGERAQWYRNVVADPRVRVTVGRRSGVPGTARVLGRDEAARTLAGYIERHRRAWRWLGPVVERTLGRSLDPAEPPPPMVEFRLEGTAGPGASG